MIYCVGLRPYGGANLLGGANAPSLIIGGPIISSYNRTLLYLSIIQPLDYTFLCGAAHQLLRNFGRVRMRTQIMCNPDCIIYGYK